MAPVIDPAEVYVQELISYVFPSVVRIVTLTCRGYHGLYCVNGVQ